jgi:hypothetical protein
LEEDLLDVVLAGYPPTVRLTDLPTSATPERHHRDNGLRTPDLEERDRVEVEPCTAAPATASRP